MPAKKTTTKKPAANTPVDKVATPPTKTEKKQALVKMVKESPINAVPYTAIVAEWVRLQCEPGFIRLVASEWLSKVVKDVNLMLDKLTDGKVRITTTGTREVNWVDTCELKEKLWY